MRAFLAACAFVLAALGSTYANAQGIKPDTTLSESTQDAASVEQASPPPIRCYMPSRPGEPPCPSHPPFGLDRPEPVLRSAAQEQINVRAEAQCDPVGDLISNENASALEQCLWDRGYRSMIENPLPPGRTFSEQREINERAVFQCGADNTACQREHGYLQLSRGPTPAQAYLEGNIIAAIAVLLGLLWLAVRVWVWLFASRGAYRYITKPRGK